MAQHYQDAMCLITKFGKPDLFITFTCKNTNASIVFLRIPNTKDDVTATPTPENEPRRYRTFPVFHIAYVFAFVFAFLLSLW